MAQPTFTKRSNEPLSRVPPSSTEALLDLPDGRDFDPPPVRSDPDLCLTWCEEWLPIVLARPGFWERREAERCPAEFDLADPTRVPITYPAEFIDDLLRGR